MRGQLVEHAGEFNLIHQLREVLRNQYTPEVIRGIGDDAAVYQIGNGLVHVISTDAFIQDYHFDLAFYSMQDVGYKAMAVNISDIAAMNASPRYATIALGLPGQIQVDQVLDIYRGIQRCADMHGVQIIGGDTTRSPVIMLSITIIGIGSEDAIVYRSGGKPDDLLCITGTLGAAVAGLHLLRREAHQRQLDPGIADLVRHHVVQRHCQPIPRTDIVRDWQVRGVRPHALIDISDGLAAEVRHLCKASKCGAELQRSSLPVTDATRAVAEVFAADPLEYALSGGDDYELLFTAPEESCQRMDPDTFTIIGKLTSDTKQILHTDGAQSTIPLSQTGHDHFAAN